MVLKLFNDSLDRACEVLAYEDSDYSLEELGL